MNKSATFSRCRKYRYTLWRDWGGLFADGYVMFIGLNPSTADEIEDDPTIRRCIGFAKNWGYAGICMTNLFSFRATLPSDMKSQSDPVGPENDRYLKDISKQAKLIIAAWGVNGNYLKRDQQVIKMINGLFHLGLTKDGFPRHPLYLKKDVEPIAWQV